MPEGIIDMQDMDATFSVTDPLGIHRELVRVELTKEDPGAIGRDANGLIQITVPETGDIREFTQLLQAESTGMGYEPVEDAEDEL